MSTTSFCEHCGPVKVAYEQGGTSWCLMCMKAEGWPLPNINTTNNKDVQETPQWFFDELNKTYHFILDAAADETNHKVDRWYGPGSDYCEDALVINQWPTDGWIWMNPPYSRGNQRKFVEKAIEQAWKGCKTLALLPADTSTRLFHELIWQRYRVEFCKKRLKFNGVKQGAKFGNMLVEFQLK